MNTLASLTEIGPPINDGERRVLARLRDELPAEWQVVSNFEIPSGNRMLECDAVAFSPRGWAYLIETKRLSGQIVGNDREWAMPSQLGNDLYYINNPVHLVRSKGKKLAATLKSHDARLSDIRIFPLVAVVSDLQPQLEGSSAGAVVLDSELCDRIIVDPRTGEPDRPPDLVELAVEALTQSAKPLKPPSRVGAFELLELLDEGEYWQVWSARNTMIGDDAPLARLKKFFLDSLATGDDRERQQALARRDLQALIRLAGSDGAVPVLATVEETEDSLAVVTAWPSGPNLAAYLERERLDDEEAQELADAFLEAVRSVHAENIVHRALTPSNAHVLRSGRVILTDFDFARIPDAPSITRYLPEGVGGPYSAPEVRDDPARASLQSDVWSAGRIVLEILGAWSERGADWDLVPRSWREPLRQAIADAPDDRWPNAQVLLQRLRAGTDTPPAARQGFLPHDVLDDRWVVRSVPTHGGIADVYRVHDTVLEADYAAKFIQQRYKDVDAVDVIEEYKRVEAVPPHPHVALPTFVQKLSSYERGRTRYELSARFLLTPWVEGESLLDTLLVERLPVARVVELTTKLARALAHLHQHGLIHRDVKPANVILDEDGEPVLVDFNITARIEEASTTAVGTPAYTPPDIAETGWTPAADTFMLALTTCEMLAGTTLGRDEVGVWLSSAPTEVRHVLAEATRQKAPRTESPIAFAQAFASAAAPLLDPASTLPDPPSRPRAHENHNPYRDELNRLFSQSRESNAGTRGLDEFARWSYLSTRIDRDLREAILSGRHRLVLITGNAGDGKTAFIQQVEHALAERGATVTPRPAGNGATIEHDGRRFETNWDGSQDEGNAENDAVLEDFFAPYAGDAPDPPASETRLIAINEGRLLDFIEDPERSARYGALSAVLRRFLSGDSDSREEWILLVNLNLRALTLPPTSDGSDIVGTTLERFADERLWKPCATCRVQGECYAYANAAQLRDPVLGPRARERIRQTLDIVRLRRRMHITMRDLRSALAFFVAGNRHCDEIVGLVDDGADTELLGGRLPNSLFGASPEVAVLADGSAERDRLLAAVAPLDVSRTADPADDARLWALGARALPTGAERRRADHWMIDRLREVARGDDGDAGHQSRLVSFVHGTLRRIQFLEREGSSWTRMFPYNRLTQFERLLQGPDDAARDAVVRAVSYSEGLFNETFEHELAVSLAPEMEGVDRSYVKHSAEAFELGVHDQAPAARYLEYAPDTLLLRFKPDPDIALELDLDLYETLGRILDGFVPSREELRGTWLNLRLFKDQLAAVPTESLLLSRDDHLFHEIRATDDGDVLEIARLL